MTKGVANNICSLPSTYFPNDNISFTSITRNGVVCVLTIGAAGLVTLTPTTGNVAAGDVFQIMLTTYAVSA